MKLAEVFSQLAYGELSQLSLVDEATGLINPSKYPALAAHVNLGLTALHTRFHLKEGRLSFKLRPTQVLYPLASSEDILGDAGEDFTDDILKVEKVSTDAGFDLGLNNSADLYGCTTPSASALRVSAAVVAQGYDLPDEYKTSNLHVVYRANHARIVVPTTGLLPAKVEVDLPYTHLEALLLYVASRTHNPIGMVNEFNAGNNYYAKYEAACARLEQKGMDVDQGSQNTRAGRAGWV